VAQCTTHDATEQLTTHCNKMLPINYYSDFRKHKIPFNKPNLTRHKRSEHRKHHQHDTFLKKKQTYLKKNDK